MTVTLLGLESVRAALESQTWAALMVAGLSTSQIVADNTTETPPPLPYAVFTVSFDGMVSDAVGNCPADHVRGAIQASIYTEKRNGAGLGESIALAVLRSWVDLQSGQWAGVGVKVTPLNMEGPRSMAASNNFDRTRNANVAVVAASFVASVEPFVG